MHEGEKANMLNKSSEKHPIGKIHIGDLGYTNHSIDDVVGKIEVLSSGKTIEHVAETSIGVLGDNHLEGVEGNINSFDLASFTRRSGIKKGITNKQRIFKRGWINVGNAGKFLKMKIDLDISNDESDGGSSIQVANKTDTFVEMKYKDWVNFLVNIEKTIKSNSHEAGENVWLVIKCMRTRSSSHLIAESSTTPKRRNRRRSKQRIEPFSLEETPVDMMADQRTMAELLQAPTDGYGDAIATPAILAENFELKHGLLNLITSMIKYKDVPNSSIKVMLFPFSIEGTTRIWLEKEPPHSILTWEDLVSKFINQFFPPSKTANLRNEITNFQQKFEETLDRFKDLLRACPHHGFTELHQLDTLNSALNPTDQDSLNATAGGNLLTKTPRDVLTIIKNKSKVRNLRNKPVVSNVSANTSSSTTACPSEMATLTDAVNAMLRHVTTSPPETVKSISESCVTCRGLHPYYECLVADGNTFNASAAVITYNQNQGYHPQGDPNYRACNQMGPPGFPPVQNNQNCFNQNQGYNQNQ
ncbi:reverse transcriptase domain-containing protein [Tanacetum coccineum]